jgi:hypothetical protein
VRDERQLMLGVVDLATEKRCPRAALLGFPEHVECVECCSGGAAQNSDD